MYHALHEGADVSRIDPEDRPYAVARDDFARQLDAVAERLARPAGASGEEAGAGDGAPPVAITFDDGHASNVELALPLLVERGLDAVFFVTSGFVGAREHFVDATMLAELVRAGMTVGGHGRTHRFFDDLDAAAARAELVGARAALEAAVGAPVRSMSFPGGRHDRRARALAREAGIGALFDSRCAVASPRALARALAVAAHGATGGPVRGPGSDSADGPADDPTDDPTDDPGDPAPIPRVAIRRDTDPDTFARMIGPDPAWYSAARRGERLRGLVRRALGNRIYHGLYKSLRAG